MAKIDISSNSYQDSVIAVEKIKFYSYDSATYSHKNAQELERASHNSESRIKDSIINIVNVYSGSNVLCIENKTHALKLIEALNLAITLDWLKEEKE